MTITTILPVDTYELDKDYTPDYDARKCIYFIPMIIWKRTPVVAKQWYDNEHDVVEGSLPKADSNIGAIVTARFLINKTTGEIKLKSYHQINLQSAGISFVNPNPVGELGLLGIIHNG